MQWEFPCHSLKKVIRECRRTSFLTQPPVHNEELLTVFPVKAPPAGYSQLPMTRKGDQKQGCAKSEL